MLKEFTIDELQNMLTPVARFSGGASVDEIHRNLEEPLPRRTLQRRLALLVARGRLNVKGRGPSVRYSLPSITYSTHAPAAPRVAENGEYELVVSGPADSVQRSVRRPIQERQPVGYDRAFLDGYRPNHTFYLPPGTREHLAEIGRPAEGGLPAGTRARQIYNRLLIDLSWNSSRLEGNTYSLLETERLLERGEAADGRDAREARMILNHKSAIEMLVDQAAEIGFNRYTIFNLHASLSEDLLGDPRSEGRLRSVPVGISGTVYHPLSGPQMIEECFQQILDTAAAINDPFEQAFFVMVQMPYLQPFDDVNKRVSRLAANIPLIQRNLSPLSFVDVPGRDYVDGILGVYELNRVELLRDVFVWAYERSCRRYTALCRSLGDPDPFRLRYRDVIKETVAAIVRGGMDKKRAGKFAAEHAVDRLPKEALARFSEVVETELMALHEGNFARYRVRPSEFEAWQAVWR